MSSSSRERLLDQLAEMPAFLNAAIPGLPTAVLAAKPAGESLSLIEHLCHLRDCERDLYGERINRVLRCDQPHLAPVDVGIWPTQRDYLNQCGSQALQDFCTLRAALLVQLRTLAEEDMQRTGMRVDASLITVYGLVEQIAEHDRDHRWRMAAILREFATRVGYDSV